MYVCVRGVRACVRACVRVCVCVGVCVCVWMCVGVWVCAPMCVFFMLLVCECVASACIHIHVIFYFCIPCKRPIFYFSQNHSNL